MLLAVHRQDELAHELTDVLGVDRRRDVLGVTKNLLDPGERRDRKVGPVGVRAHPVVRLEHRALLARLLPQRVGLTGDEVDLDIELRRFALRHGTPLPHPATSLTR